MKKFLILTGLLLLCLFPQNTNGQDKPVVEGSGHINGFLDHVLATLPAKQYAAIDTFLTGHFKYCWMKQQGKGFIFCNAQRPYVELWDSGVFYQFGHQVGFASPDPDAKERAQKYYGSEGTEFDMGIFTVGKDGQGGHPVGGTFYVSYGTGGKIPVNDSMKIERCTGLITSIPEPGKDVINDYKFFNLSATESNGIYTLRDTAGFTVQIMPLPIEAIVFGHIALLFRLKEAVPERQEYNLTGQVKAIIDDKDFILVLNNNLYSEFIRRQ